MFPYKEKNSLELFNTIKYGTLLCRTDVIIKFLKYKNKYIVFKCVLISKCDIDKIITDFDFTFL